MYKIRLSGFWTLFGTYMVFGGETEKAAAASAAVVSGIQGV